MEMVKSGLDAGGISDGTSLDKLSADELHESPRKCKLSASSNPGNPNPRPTKMMKKDSSNNNPPSSPTYVVVDKADGACEILVGDKPRVVVDHGSKQETDDDSKIKPPTDSQMNNPMDYDLSFTLPGSDSDDDPDYWNNCDPNIGLNPANECYTSDSDMGL